MDNTFSLDKAKEILESGAREAQELIQDPSKVDELLAQLEEKLKEVPVAGTTLAEVPLLVSMVKGYITREYTEVSPKVIASIVSAFLYLVKKKDLIPDNIPVIGLADDIAVITLALKLVEPELNAFAKWRAGEEPVEAEVEEAEVEEAETEETFV
ncbi:MAG: DUF1232 domain-containing protein [Blautia sp.]|nr:DUF1232 domain-containing protein [Blautia sp.]